MDPRISHSDDKCIESHLLKSQCLEKAYQDTLRKAELIIKDEGARRLRLRVLLLENENNDLHEQLASEGDRVDALEQEGEELRRQLEQAQENSCRHEAELRAQTRELNNLRVELSSMNGLTMDSTKLLTEKLSLARELATLKPELEHLRSQSAYQQTVLSEKLALQRQVSTLEVELDTEKRASKRAAQKNDGRERELELQSQLEDLRKDLIREKREREKFRKDAENDLNASEARKVVLESKLDQISMKLRTTKEQLKKCETELGQVRAGAGKARGTSTRTDVPAKNPRKRAALEMSTDDAIRTPDRGAVRGKRPAVKQGRIDQTMVGEKSMFSVTPFLNRTINVAAETPVESIDSEPAGGKGEEASEPTTEFRQATENTQYDSIARCGSKGRSQPQVPTNEHMADISQVHTSTLSAPPKVNGKTKTAEKILILEDNALGESKADMSNKKKGPKKSRSVSTLEKVVEEVDENEHPDETGVAVTEQAGTGGVRKVSKVQAKNAEETEPKRKKRKLLGGAAKTLFDEEDGEAPKRPTKMSLGPSRVLSRGGLLGPKGGLKGGVENGNTFGAFSPLKKDRRGVGASFLA